VRSEKGLNPDAMLAGTHVWVGLVLMDNEPISNSTSERMFICQLSKVELLEDVRDTSANLRNLCYEYMLHRPCILTGWHTPHDKIGAQVTVLSWSCLARNQIARFNQWHDSE
jgi:hypothetical protein